MYTLIRLGIFAVVLAVLLLLQIQPFIAAIVAALISLCISIIFLRKPREEASKTLHAARANRGQAARAKAMSTSDDENVEDTAVDAAAPVEASDPARTVDDAGRRGEPQS